MNSENSPLDSLGLEEKWGPFLQWNLPTSFWYSVRVSPTDVQGVVFDGLSFTNDTIAKISWNEVTSRLAFIRQMVEKDNLTAAESNTQSYAILYSVVLFRSSDFMPGEIKDEIVRLVASWLPSLGPIHCVFKDMLAQRGIYVDPYTNLFTPPDGTSDEESVNTFITSLMQHGLFFLSAAFDNLDRLVSKKGSDVVLPMERMIMQSVLKHVMYRVSSDDFSERKNIARTQCFAHCYNEQFKTWSQRFDDDAVLEFIESLDLRMGRNPEHISRQFSNLFEVLNSSKYVRTVFKSGTPDLLDSLGQVPVLRPEQELQDVMEDLAVRSPERAAEMYSQASLELSRLDQLTLRLVGGAVRYVKQVEERMQREGIRDLNNSAPKNASRGSSSSRMLSSRGRGRGGGSSAGRGGKRQREDALNHSPPITTPSPLPVTPEPSNVLGSGPGLHFIDFQRQITSMQEALTKIQGQYLAANMQQAVAPGAWQGQNPITASPSGLQGLKNVPPLVSASAPAHAPTNISSGTSASQQAPKSPSQSAPPAPPASDPGVTPTLHMEEVQEPPSRPTDRRPLRRARQPTGSQGIPYALREEQRSTQ